jgi:hypothetical protein
MRSAHRATKISIALTMGVVYPFILLADALAWSAWVELALGILALVTLVGTKLALTDWNEWRVDRVRLRQERAARKREASELRRTRRADA